MKKILHIVESFGSGVYNYLINLLNNTADDLEIVVLYARREHTPENFKKDFDNRIKFIESQFMHKDISMNDFKAFKEIKDIVKKEKPDIVHLHSSKAGFLGRMAINTRKIKTFYTPHGYSFFMQDSTGLKKNIYKIIEKVATLNCSVTIACSKAEYEETLKLTRKAMYVNNGVNLNNLLSRYIPEKSKDIDVKNLKIVTSGRITYQKNPGLFNEIAENFKDIKFTWVGSGDLESELKSKNIEITGWKDKAEVIKILNDSDVFVLTSLGEGLSVSLIEAMALKKICIVSNVIGNKEVIENGRNGFICNNLEEFKNVINLIRNGKFDLREIADNAHKDVLEKYNTKIMCEEYLKIYGS